MSKHTTHPLPVRKVLTSNSHAAIYGNQTMGNWNRHKKRRIDSRMRTKGRNDRWWRRHEKDRTTMTVEFTLPPPELIL